MHYEYTAISDADVPKICVVLRKAYGAGLYAMCGPGFEPDATLALPQASIAVMGPEAAVNAVYYNKIQEKPEAERAAYVESLREQYREDVDIYKLAAELHIDAIVPGAQLRDELGHVHPRAAVDLRRILPSHHRHPHTRHGSCCVETAPWPG